MVIQFPTDKARKSYVEALRTAQENLKNDDKINSMVRRIMDEYWPHRHADPDYKPIHRRTK